MPPVTRPVILAALLAAALAGGAYLFWRSQHPALPDGLVQANGRIEGDHVLIASKFPGRLAKVLVREGDTVQAGQVLAELDDSQIQAKLAQASAAVAAVNAPPPAPSRPVATPNALTHCLSAARWTAAAPSRCAWPPPAPAPS